MVVRSRMANTPCWRKKAIKGPTTASISPRGVIKEVSASGRTARLGSSAEKLARRPIPISTAMAP